MATPKRFEAELQLAVSAGFNVVRQSDFFVQSSTKAYPCVIASEAKQSRNRAAEIVWIASLRSQ
ncbi:hypothetical protein JJC00_02160 [Bradyrhizobium diazoefficiens]|uniref:hypothetical protein n=1 Tax=Bradyrhizobium diazoefficiens TaxID=1355477 RepID=UPI00190926B8|nr:hypothetical protein [Bradyrhizobium diazoefficiens]QQO34532.1 hypothetical protein JJC00_02160 [Bradyrhizobium diazoefficiens]